MVTPPSKKWLYIWLKDPNRSVVNLEIDPIILDPGVYFNYFSVISEQ